MSLLSPPALVVEGLGKRFDIYPNDRSRFFELFGDRSHHAEHWALRGVSFEVQTGEAFGIIGSNGAGKSTLLRILAGITPPTEGRVVCHGRMSTLLDLGVGFQGSFTGRENIRLSCALLGLEEAEIDALTPDIIRFAELGAFIDHPARTYSSGMSLRLGFSIAVHVQASILVIDEVLAVGDRSFQRKCVERIRQLRAQGVTLVLVSHDLHTVRSLCERVLWLDQGEVKRIGPPRELVERYLDLSTPTFAPPPPRPTLPLPEAPRPTLPEAPRAAPPPSDPAPAAPDLTATLRAACALPDAARRFTEAAGEAPRVADGDTLLVDGTGEARILRVQLLTHEGAARETFTTGEDLIVAVTLRTLTPLQDPIFGVAIFREDGVYVYGPNTQFDRALPGRYHGVYTFYAHYPALPLLAGRYRLSVALFDAGHIKPYVYHNQLHPFEVQQAVEDHGLVRLEHRWGVLAHFTADDP